MSSLVWTHTRYQFLEQLRVPIAIVASVFFPTISMLAFVVPFTGDDPLMATVGTASMTLFAVMSSSLMGLAIGVADDRGKPWDPYVRTLPAGPFPRFAGRMLTSLAIMLIAVVPVVLVAAFLTAATATPLQLLSGLGALIVGALPFMMLGLLVGYALPSKAAIAVSQVLFFPIAIGGGMFGNPLDPPAFIGAVAPYLPSRGAMELVWAATAGVPPRPLPLVMLAVWTVAGAAAAVWAYRRDEGRRFR
ncbi:ABC transporter permease [Nonomuraea sp. NPDC003804]|uniref:ABC transporter permease n=1 Tax=Nonomuraea sp. NPDC003804 TaxID=3154547 RepID=UPI0033B018AD